MHRKFDFGLFLGLPFACFYGVRVATNTTPILLHLPWCNFSFIFHNHFIFSLIPYLFHNFPNRRHPIFYIDRLVQQEFVRQLLVVYGLGPHCPPHPPSISVELFFIICADSCCYSPTTDGSLFQSNVIAVLWLIIKGIIWL